MSVTSFQTIIRHLIRHPDDLTSNDDLGWKLLDKDFVLKGIKDSSYDVDFLSITGPCEKFIDDVRIESLISAGRSKIFNKMFTKILKRIICKICIYFCRMWRLSSWKINR